MRIGVPTEVKPDEYRVAMTPDGVRELVGRGHHVRVQSGAGLGSALPDAAFAQQGAEIVPDADAVFAGAEMVLKVKEPQPQRLSVCAAGRRCSRTCTSPPMPSSRARCARRARPASPMRPSRSTDGSRCLSR